MESAIVIKVKYGDTLRRFSVPVNEKKQLDLDMSRLRGKILSLFNFAPDADLILTYIDEDGDVVTLADDNDLCDVMSQRLKFLRIAVQLNDEKSGNSSASSVSATHTTSPQIQKPGLPNISVGVNEVLKLIPNNPLYEALSKLSLDLASKATSSSPVLAELLEHFSKMSHSHLNPVSQSGPVSSSQGSSSAGLKTPLVFDNANASKDYGSQEVLRKSNLVTEQTKKVKIENVAQGVGAPNLSEATPVDLNVNPPIYATSNNDTRVHKEIDGHLNGESVAFGLPDMEKSTRSTNAVRCRNAKLIGNLTNECPFSGMTINNHAAVPPHIYPFKRSNNRYDAAVGMFHKGVRCDGCGVHPITGPRFKSKVKENYDLCSICFSEMGNEVDYIRMDRPHSYRHPQSVQGLHDYTQHRRVGSHKMRQLLRSVSVKPAQLKLDSCFISDVNVLDGTVMAPSTSFTKIWLMRNCGDSVWPQGSQLVWIGGDRFSTAISVNVEIPADGLPIDGELDIAVDFIAPQSPGRYISYWRMATPSGVKFGQRVWVLIQVDGALKDAYGESSQDINLNVTLQDEVDGYQGFNLNYPPVSSGSKFPQMLDMNVVPVSDGVSSLPSGNAVPEQAKPVVVAQAKEGNTESNFPINDALLVGSGASAPPASVGFPSEDNSPVSYPIIDLYEATAAGTAYATPLVQEVPISSEGAKENNEVEKSLLEELEMMGFKEVDLNKETLRRNEYNLEQSLDDLCGDAEWDTILEELQEMGFCNEEANKRLLKKNNGSIKRVVMELLSGEEV